MINLLLVLSIFGLVFCGMIYCITRPNHKTVEMAAFIFFTIFFATLTQGVL